MIINRNVFDQKASAKRKKRPFARVIRTAFIRTDEPTTRAVACRCGKNVTREFRRAPNTRARPSNIIRYDLSFYRYGMNTSAAETVRSRVYAVAENRTRFVFENAAGNFTRH